MLLTTFLIFSKFIVILIYVFFIYIILQPTGKWQAAINTIIMVEQSDVFERTNK